MKFEYSNNKPFIYLSYPKAKEEETFRALEFLGGKGVSFCHADEINKKEFKHIKASFAVLVFLDKEHFIDANFRKVIDQAVKCNKNILTVYLDDVDLDSWGHMQLDSAQALYKSAFKGEGKTVGEATELSEEMLASAEEAFNKKLSEAAIFQNMAVTKEQKHFQKVRGVSLVAIPVLALALIFFTVINPLLIAPNKAMKAEFGLAGLSSSELQNIETLIISGDRVFTNYEIDNEVIFVHAYYGNDQRGNLKCVIVGVGGATLNTTSINRGTIIDVSDLAQLKNLKTLCISAQKIRDISPLFELENLEELDVECNPITSIEGIEKLTKLRKLNLCGTDVKDLTPVNGLKNLEVLSFEQSKVSVPPSTELLSGIVDLCINDCKMPSIGIHKENINFDMRNSGRKYNRDISFIDQVENFERFSADDLSIEQINLHLSDKNIRECNTSNVGGLSEISMLNLPGLTWRLDVCWTKDLVSLNGVEKFDHLSEISIKHCNNIADLSPLNNLQNPKEIIVSTDMIEQYKAQVHNDKLRMRIED